MHGNHNVLLATIQFPTTWHNNFVFEMGDRILALANLRQLGSKSFYYQQSNHSFGGVTHVWFLSESHMVLETFRESNILELEIVTCKGHLADRNWKEIFEAANMKLLAITHLKKVEGHKWQAF